MKVYEQIKEKINIHGELHLDKVQTNILMTWLEAVETIAISYENKGKELEDLIQRLMDIK